MKRSVKNPFPLVGKLLPLLGIEKMEENWFTLNLNNCVHQEKKALNKSTKFVINRKSIPTSQNEEFLGKCDFTGPKKIYFQEMEKLLPMEGIFEILAQNGFH